MNDPAGPAMIQFSFKNLRDVAVGLVIEPWAMLEHLEPDQSVWFEVTADPPPHIVFLTLEPDGAPCIDVYAERVVIRTPTDERIFTA